MDPQLYLTFVLATTILILIPGPAVTLILATSLAQRLGDAVVWA